MKEIAARNLKGINISEHVRVYNANANKPKLPPRIRIQITNLPMKVIKANNFSLGLASSGAKGGTRATAKSVPKIASATSGWANNRAIRSLGSVRVAGVLAFAPSAMIDAADAYETSATGIQSFNWRKFAVASAKSQSANAAGFAVGLAATAFVSFWAVAAAPIVLVGLGAGIIAQVGFNSAGFQDQAERFADQHLPK